VPFDAFCTGSPGSELGVRGSSDIVGGTSTFSRRPEPLGKLEEGVSLYSFKRSCGRDESRRRSIYMYCCTKLFVRS
jgi:hypothetical protein